MSNKITKKQAEQILDEVRKWGAERGIEAEEFSLHDGEEHEGLSAGSWVIWGEGTGLDWAIELSMQPTQVVPSDSGIFLEPVYAVCLGIYPA